MSNIKDLFSALKISALSLCLAGCSNFISVQTDYLSHQNLASYHVNTPDPLLNNPPIGQRLIISWSISRSLLDYEDLHFAVRLRFRNREEATLYYQILKKRGVCVYTLLNEDYLSKGGILSYKVDLVADGNILEEWRHQIWTETIRIGQDECPEADDRQESTSEDDIDFET